VTDAVVLPIEGPNHDILVHALLAMEDAARADEAVRLANKQLAPHQQVRGFTVWPEPDFPRTHTLKVRRPEIERRLSEVLVSKFRAGARV
jgi:long-chain acyl-CoA synthetase